MRRLSLLLGTLLIVSMLLAACGAEETSTTVPSTDVPPITSEATMTEAATTETPAAGDLTTTPAVPVTGEDDISRLTNLLDLDIWNQNGEQVGEVEDMVLDVDNSKITYVIIETGGFLDIGDKTVLIPWNSLDLQTTAEGAPETAFVLTADAEMLDNAPGVDLESVLPGIGETVADWDADIRNFWETGVVPEVSTDATATTTTDATAVPEMTATSATGSGAGTGTGQGSGQEKLQGVMLASDVLGATITVGQGSREGVGEATAEPAATVELTAMPEATTDTENQGPTEATIEDVIVDPDAGDILYLVLNSLFDDGERWIPVPLSTLRWDAANEAFLFVANANALLNAPFFQADQWPDTTVDGWDADFDTFWQTNVTTP